MLNGKNIYGKIDLKNKRILCVFFRQIYSKTEYVYVHLSVSSNLIFTRLKFILKNGMTHLGYETRQEELRIPFHK